jgi:hypothetical protein
MEITSLLYNIVLGMATLESRERNLTGKYAGWYGQFGPEWCLKKTMGSGENYWGVFYDAGVVNINGQGMGMSVWKGKYFFRNLV